MPITTTRFTLLAQKGRSLPSTCTSSPLPSPTVSSLVDHCIALYATTGHHHHHHHHCDRLGDAIPPQALFHGRICCPAPSSSSSRSSPSAPILAHPPPLLPTSTAHLLRKADRRLEVAVALLERSIAASGSPNNNHHSATTTIVKRSRTNPTKEIDATGRSRRKRSTHAMRILEEEVEKVLRHATELHLSHLLNAMSDHVEPVVLPRLLCSVAALVAEPEEGNHHHHHHHRVVHRQRPKTPTIPNNNNNKKNVLLFGFRSNDSCQIIALTVWMYVHAVMGWSLLEHSEALWDERTWTVPYELRRQSRRCFLSDDVRCAKGGGNAKRNTQPRQRRNDDVMEDEGDCGHEWPLVYGAPLGAQRATLVAVAGLLCQVLYRPPPPRLQQEDGRSAIHNHPSSSSSSSSSNDPVGWSAFAVIGWLRLLSEATRTSVGGTPHIVEAAALRDMAASGMLTRYVVALLHNLLLVQEEGVDDDDAMKKATPPLFQVTSEFLRDVRRSYTSFVQQGLVGGPWFASDWQQFVPSLRHGGGGAAERERALVLSSRSVPHYRRLLALEESRGSQTRSCAGWFPYSNSPDAWLLSLGDSLLFRDAVHWIPCASWNAVCDLLHDVCRCQSQLLVRSGRTTPETAQRMEKLQMVVRLLLHRVVQLEKVTTFRSSSSSLLNTSSEEREADPIRLFHQALLQFVFAAQWNVADLPPAYQRLLVDRV